MPPQAADTLSLCRTDPHALAYIHFVHERSFCVERARNYMWDFERLTAHPPES